MATLDLLCRSTSLVLAEDAQEVGLSWCDNPWSPSREITLHVATLTAFKAFILSCVLTDLKMKIITGFNNLNPLQGSLWALSSGPP